MSAIYEQGMSVPEDVAIVGCDDISISAMSRPTLSTIAVPAYDIGVRAVQLLDERVKGVQREPITAIMEHRYVWRESSGGHLI
ncbi:Catabolite control protein A [compost metagenome]